MSAASKITFINLAGEEVPVSQNNPLPTTSSGGSSATTSLNTYVYKTNIAFVDSLAGQIPVNATLKENVVIDLTTGNVVADSWAYNGVALSGAPNSQNITAITTPQQVTGSQGDELAKDSSIQDVIAAINSQTGTLVYLDPLGTVNNIPQNVNATGTLVDVIRNTDTSLIIAHRLTGTNTAYTPVGTLEPFVVAYGSVNVTASALPTGAATDASLASIATKLDTIHADLVTENTTLTTINTSVGSVITAVNAVTTATQEVKTSIEAGNVSSATIATQTATLTTALASIQTLIASGNTTLGVLHTDGVDLQALVTAGNTSLSAIQTALGSEATAANQTLAITALASLNASATSQLTKLDTIASNITALGTTLGAGKTLADIVTAINADADAAEITALQTALTTLESAGNVSLASIDAKTPALGQALAAQSSPVVLPASQVTALTPPSNAGYALDGTDATGVVQLTGGVGIRGWLSSIYSKLSSSIAITAAALPLPTGAATAALQPALNADGGSLAHITGGIVSITSTARTATLLSASIAGSVAAGCTEISFFNSGSASATVAGGTLDAGFGVTFTAPKGDTLNAVAYDGTGTTLMISKVA